MRSLIALTLWTLLLPLAPALAQGLTVPGMPSDYDGITFGTSMDQIPDVGFVFSRQELVPSELFGDYVVDYYMRAQARTEFAGVQLLDEEFGFENNRFSHVLLTAEGRKAYEAFVAHAAAEYGMEEFSPFSIPDYPDCVKIHRTEDYDGTEGHGWLWGVQQSDDIFMVVRVRYDPATNTATYRVGWPY